MSYNSNGYIMLDFSMLDFSRTNQIIDGEWRFVSPMESAGGIYQRVFEIVGTNKFVLILNAQSKTPLPACVSFVNSSYVIESFLYNFAITMDDNVRIENVSSDIIKDGIISAGTTWSSSKIKDELDNKVNTSSLSEVAISGNYNDLLDKPDLPVYGSDIPVSSSTTETVAQAIEGINGLFDDLLKVVYFSNSESILIPANGAINVTAQQMNISTPTGYVPIAIGSVYSSSNSVIFRSFSAYVTGTSSFGVARNVSNEAINAIFNCSILFAKSSIVSYG